MAANGSELVKLSQLKNLYNSLVAKINGVLADGSVTTNKIADSAVTGVKIAADAVTSDKIATGAVTSDAIANGTITAGDIAEGVIPDVSGFVTETEADAAYAAKSHTHPASQVTGLTASRALVSDASGHPAVSAVTSTELGYLDGVTSAVQTQLNGKAASSHNHSASDITSGTLPVARGGTGVTANPSMLVNLASTAADTVFEATPRPGVTGTLPIARGGTGATSASAARTALGAAASSHTHSNATTSTAGFMSAADKTKLDGLSNESYTLPQASDTVLGGVKFPTTAIAQGYLGY